jgi:hypothetical protein
VVIPTPSVSFLFGFVIYYSAEVWCVVVVVAQDEEQWNAKVDRQL